MLARSASSAEFETTGINLQEDLHRMKILPIAILFSFQSVVFAGDYYVALNGNDSNSGMIQSPFKTLGKANSSVGPGDSVIIRGGEYPFYQNITVRGSEGSPITFRPYLNEKVTFKGSYIPGDMTFDRSHSVKRFILCHRGLACLQESRVYE